MPDADIINIDDRRHLNDLPPEARVIVTFCSSSFVFGSDNPQTLSPHYEVAAGKALELIEEARRLGGVWLPAENDRLWFLPWPPAAVCIRPAT
ncbi:MAG TPA: hypothetical protein VHT03_01575 [Rhizomicrobium sp.]|jgi:hypothetical protein|nr:hypothetical protein [Rhizomicrobium sp.]